MRSDAFSTTGGRINADLHKIKHNFSISTFYFIKNANRIMRSTIFRVIMTYLCLKT